MTSLGLLLWIIFGIFLQVGLFLGISFWQHWQTYIRLKQGQAELQVPVASVNSPKEESAGWPGFRVFKVASRAIEDSSQQICSFYLVLDRKPHFPNGGHLISPTKIFPIAPLRAVF